MPVEDRLETLLTMSGLAVAAHFVALTGKAEQLGGCPVVKQGREVLLRLLDGAAKVVLCVDDQRRCAHVLLSKVAGRAALGLEVALAAVEVKAAYDAAGLAAAIAEGERAALMIAGSYAAGAQTAAALKAILPNVPGAGRVPVAVAVGALSAPFSGDLFDYAGCGVLNLSQVEGVVYDFYKPSGLFSSQRGYCLAYTQPGYIAPGTPIE